MCLNAAGGGVFSTLLQQVEQKNHDGTVWFQWLIIMVWKGYEFWQYGSARMLQHSGNAIVGKVGSTAQENKCCVAVHAIE